LIPLIIQVDDISEHGGSRNALGNIVRNGAKLSDQTARSMHLIDTHDAQL
jgi:hypothetical protein